MTLPKTEPAYAYEKFREMNKNNRKCLILKSNEDRKLNSEEHKDIEAIPIILFIILPTLVIFKFIDWIKRTEKSDTLKEVNLMA
jgi:hypothetical protein